MEISKEMVATWGLRVGTQFVPATLIEELCEQDAFSTEFGCSPVNVPPMMARGPPGRRSRHPADQRLHVRQRRTQSHLPPMGRMTAMKHYRITSPPGLFRFGIPPIAADWYEKLPSGDLAFYRYEGEATEPEGARVLHGQWVAVIQFEPTVKEIEDPETFRDLNEEGSVMARIC